MKDWLTHRAQASPEATALVESETGTEWTYAALDAAVDETAGRLAALGIESGDHLGMLLSARVTAVHVVHAAMRLGATLVPLNVRLTAHELTYEVGLADLTALVCEAETETQAVDACESAGSVPVVSIDEPGRQSVAAFESMSPVAVESAEWEDDDRLALMFTSGTTGNPKAVTLTMGNILSSAIASAFRLGVLPEDRWLVTLALYHMGGLAPLYRSALYGTCVVLRRTFEPGGAADDIATYDVTGVSLVPTMLQSMLDDRGTLADSLRFILLGGAPASQKLIRRCRDYMVPVHPTYGMTETASQISTARPTEAFQNLDTVGRPLFWTDVTVVDEAGDPVGTGETGELVVSGPIVSPGYYGNPSATAEAFGPSGLRTGDIGYRDEAGRLYVLNRVDDRIITGGENVDPGEIVEALREQPGVRDATVVGVPDETWGERVAALVVPSDPELTVEAVEEYCRERLAGYKLPRVIAFEDSLPRTASGTVERATVRERLTAISEGHSDVTDDQVIEADASVADEDGDDVVADEEGGDVVADEGVADDEPAIESDRAFSDE